MKRLLLVPVLSFFLASCAHQLPPVSDSAADAKLGLTSEDQTEETEETVAQIQEAHRKEQKRNLERIITEPDTQPSTLS